METITLNTGRSDFRLIHRILEVAPQTMTGVYTFSNDPDYLGLESLAQLCAMHVRYLVDFREHAFLLKIRHFLSMTPKPLHGPYHLRATLLSQGGRAYAYTSELMKENVATYTGGFLIATKPYDHRFREASLKTHYAQVFSCLRNDIKTGS